MRERDYFLTEKFVEKIQSICKQRPEAAYYDYKFRRLTVNDMELFGLSVRQIDNRSLPIFLKRLKSIGFRVIESENVTIYEWSRSVPFQLNKQIAKVNQSVASNLKKRQTLTQNIVKRKEYINSMLQKLVFQLLISNKGDSLQLSKRVEASLGQVQNIIKATTIQTVQAIDEVQKLQETEIFIYKNLIANENQYRY